MFREFILAALIVAGSVNIINAECANACNGHGKCTSYDMCICNRNWQASDCSERVCQFGLAHVDSPKGDLDMSGAISNADQPVAENSLTYPYGTTESFPAMQTSDLQTLTNTAHFYMECSNKGTCNRASGECECYDGYDGASCQRASCPNSCSGHGVCKTAEAISKSDSGNTYKLWDRQSTMGCQCDKGYGGPDCSERHCKYGIDPLYFDDTATIKYSTYNFAVVTTGASVAKTAFTDGTGTASSGTWAIRFFDVAGEDWLTAPIPIGSSCEIIVAALEALPNDVIPKGFTVCTKAFSADTARSGNNVAFGTTTINELDYDGTQDVWENPAVLEARRRPIIFSAAFWDAALETGAINTKIGVLPAAATGLSSSYDKTTAIASFSGYVYRIKFYGNPGKLQEPQIEIYLDGKRPSLQVATKVPITRVWTDGQQGENEDYFADHCDGVTVRIGKSAANRVDTTYSYLVLPNNEAINKLKACLGGSDDDETNNADVYNWDFGNHYFPHLIKLVRSTTTFNDGGYYAAVIYVPINDNEVGNDNARFVLVNPFESLDSDGSSGTPAATGTDVYDVYTTKGTLALTTNTVRRQTYPSSGLLTMTNEAIFGMASNEIIMTEITANSADPVGQSSGSVSCEHVDRETNLYCLNKTDIFTMLHINPGSDFASASDYRLYGSVRTGKYANTFFNLNPPKLNLYTANNIYSKPYAYSLSNQGFSGETPSAYGANVIKTDISTNWASALKGFGATNTNHPQFQIYKFTPAPASTYEYVAECSNRGICDYTSGTCTCFSGYSSDACQVQNSLAV